jgi:hypothetical protein
MSLIDVTIPFNNGSIASVAESQLYYETGSDYLWVGGGNGRKFISLRFQSNPNFYFTNVFEVDDMTATQPVFTDLGGECRPMADLHDTTHFHGKPINTCRLSSTTVYMKIVAAMNTSFHFIIELDDVANTVNIISIDDQLSEAILKGGASRYYNKDGSRYGKGHYQTFMHCLADNRLVIYSAHNNYYVNTSSSTVNLGGLTSQLDWDPVTKTMTETSITNNNGNSGYTQRSDEYRLPKFRQPETIIYNGTSTTSSFGRPSSAGLGNASGIIGNSYAQPSGWDSQAYIGWFDVTESRDGDSIHFTLMGQTNQKTNGGDWQSINAGHYNWTDTYYCLTYVKSTNTWTTTSRRESAQQNYVGGNRLGTWLPLNTVLSNSVNDHADIRDDQTHAAAWLVIGTEEMRVVGDEAGGVMSINPRDFAENPNVTDINLDGDNAESVLQTMWLNDDHFISIWADTFYPSAMLSNTRSYKLGYTIVKYIDENAVEVVSANYLTGSTEGSPNIMDFDPTRLFTKIDQFTLFSDQFARPMTISAPE